jgi:uncharacterized protein (TIGR02186 family)
VRPTLIGPSLSSVGMAQGGRALVVDPPRARIGLFYEGVRLTVSSVVDTGTDVAVLVSGPESALHLRKQARVWGAFWAPSGSVTFEHVPSVYLLRTSGAMERLAPASVLGELGIGYESLRSAVGSGADGDLFPDLIRLKESEHLFGVSMGEVRAEPMSTGQEMVTTVVELPAKARPATYRVRFFGFRAGALVVQEEREFALTRGGFNAFVDSLAQRRGLLYGILAVVVAVGAGLLVGAVFGSVKGH